jgi:glycosyltransferase involved in cell wall biosynthesis
MKIALMGPITAASIAPYLADPLPEGFPTGVSGAPFMSVLIGALLARGHEVIAINSGGYVATRDTLPLCLKGERFEFHCCPSRRHSLRPSHGRIGRILDFYGYERGIVLQVLAQVRPDFVHAHWTYEYALAAIDSGLPHLVTAHDDPLVVLKLFRNFYRFGRYLMARRALARASALSAVSADLQTRLISYTATPIEVIPNPLNPRFSVAGKPRAALSEGEAHRFISVMNGWGHWKNASTALRAFALIHRQFPHTTYHLFGAGYEPEGPAQKWARTKKLAEGVVFHGPTAQEQLIVELKLATVMLHPSRWEACPMGIAEAMALGLPIVGGRDSGGVAWMIGGGGEVVDINRASDIAEAALRLVNEEDRYTRSSAAAIERVKDFSPDFIAEQYESAYRKAIENFRLKK